MQQTAHELLTAGEKGQTRLARGVLHGEAENAKSVHTTMNGRAKTVNAPAPNSTTRDTYSYKYSTNGGKPTCICWPYT